jgi:acyl-CoA synthetase (AMP-forming)/AMP-acid ligase II
VEAYLRTHPKVIDCSVVGVPDKRVGEEVCAWFKLKPECELTIEEVKQFCKGNIAHFKVPRYMKIVDGFPTNPNGKVLKNKILEMAKKDLNL